MKGFTLLELMVVVAIMAVIAGGTIMTVFGNGNDNILHTAKTNAARHEMEQLRQALLQYSRDGLTFPSGSPITNLNFLVKKDDQPAWNIDYHTGWRGPYISGGDIIIDQTSGENQMLDPFKERMPYQLVNLNNTELAHITSFGPNASDDSGNADDLVLNLY